MTLPSKPPAYSKPSPTTANPNDNRICSANTINQFLSSRLLKFLVFRINFLYLCFFIFNLRCLFTLIALHICLFGPLNPSSHA